MQYILQIFLALLFFNSVRAQEKQQTLSPFVVFPGIANKISNAKNVEQVNEIYTLFEKDFPEEKYIQAGFLLDQVNTATSNRLLSLQDNFSIKFIVKVRNHILRRQLLERYPSKSWKLNLIDSIGNYLFLKLSKNQNQSEHILNQLIYADFLSFTENVDVVKNYLGRLNNDKDFIKLNPHLYSWLYANQNQYDKALEILATVVKTGKADDYTRKKLKEIWNKTYDTTRSYTEYYASLMQNVRYDKMAILKDKETKYKAPDFSLYNIKKEKVSLKELKNKVVFVDFWATWCGPCIAAFPTMNKIIEHFKDNEDVVFLFINTMENDEKSRLEKINHILKKQKLDFNVLLDTNSKNSFSIANKYKVSGLPSQFIIDKKGEVRFVLKGFDGNVDSMIEEIKLMIDTTLTF